MKIAIITGSRSEFFILKNLILKIQKSRKIKSSIIFTGSLLSSYFGDIYKYLKHKKIFNKFTADILIKGDTKKDIINSVSKGIKVFSSQLNIIKPDLVLVLGDRYEIFSATVASCLSNFPLAHIHGGEVTQGSIDDSFRHSITKFSHLHFVANKAYYKRVIQLGEERNKVFNVGSLGVENLKKIKMLSKNEIENKLKIKFRKKNILVTFNPETTENKNNNKNFLKNLLIALAKFKKSTIIFTMPNADNNFKMIVSDLKKFISRNKNAYLFKFLGDKYYFSVCNHVDLMVGNSSSGIIEMPSFKKPTVNLGLRQEGRIKAKSVIDGIFNSKDIEKKINYCYSKNFLKKIKNQKNPYDNGNTSTKIIKILENFKISKNFKKKFIDIK